MWNLKFFREPFFRMCNIDDVRPRVDYRKYNNQESNQNFSTWRTNIFGIVLQLDYEIRYSIYEDPQRFSSKFIRIV